MRTPDAHYAAPRYRHRYGEEADTSQAFGGDDTLCVDAFLTKQPCPAYLGTDGKVLWTWTGPVAWWKDRNTIMLDCRSGNIAKRVQMIERVGEGAPRGVNVVCAPWYEARRRRWASDSAPLGPLALERMQRLTRQGTPRWQRFREREEAEQRERRRRRAANRRWAKALEDLWRIESRRLVYQGEPLWELATREGLPTQPPYPDPEDLPWGLVRDTVFRLGR